jgi:hypothetical protein
VAEWAIELARATETAPEALDVERRRLLDEVLPRWDTAAFPPGLVDDLRSVRGVLQHNDLGCWNIVRSNETFKVLDWESAREVGMPLWDLLYFLTDALTHVDGEWEDGRRDAYTARLFRGDAPSSALLFDWLARAARASRVSPDRIGTLATLCWLHHGLSFETRSATAAVFASDLPTPQPTARRLTDVWLSEPGLTPRWEALIRHIGAG